MNQAATHCAGLKLGPTNDDNGWRLPSMQELYSIVDARRANPAVSQALLPDTPVSGFMLSRTQYGGTPITSAGLELADGQQSSVPEDTPAAVKCVRIAKK